MDERRIPTLTDVVRAPDAPAATAAGLSDADIAELQTRLSAESFALVERLLHTAMKELGITVENVVAQVRTAVEDPRPLMW